MISVFKSFWPHLCSILYCDLGQGIIGDGADFNRWLHTVQAPSVVCDAGGDGGHRSHPGQVPQPGHEEL